MDGNGDDNKNTIPNLPMSLPFGCKYNTDIIYIYVNI